MNNTLSLIGLDIESVQGNRLIELLRVAEVLWDLVRITTTKKPSGSDGAAEDVARFAQSRTRALRIMALELEKPLPSLLVAQHLRQLPLAVASIEIMCTATKMTVRESTTRHDGRILSAIRLLVLRIRTSFLWCTAGAAANVCLTALEALGEAEVDIEARADVMRRRRGRRPG